MPILNTSPLKGNSDFMLLNTSTNLAQATSAVFLALVSSIINVFCTLSDMPESEPQNTVTATSGGNPSSGNTNIRPFDEFLPPPIVYVRPGRIDGGTLDGGSREDAGSVVRRDAGHAPDGGMAGAADASYPDASIADAGFPDAGHINNCDPDGDGFITDQITDQAFLAGIRETMGLGPNEEIPLQAALDVTSIILRGKGIRSIVGVQCFESVKWLYLENNLISDACPASMLPTLWIVDLNNNQVADANCFSRSHTLKGIDLSGNQLTDVFFASGLADLESLYACRNRVSDISPIDGLRRLRRYCFRSNDVSDISASRDLPDLEVVYMGSNPRLTNMQPLIDNPGIGAGDIVEIYGNSQIPSSQIRALQDRGVEVQYYPEQY